MFIAGDVLIVDKCIVSATLKASNWNYCSLCNKHSYSLVPCKQCGDVNIFVCIEFPHLIFFAFYIFIGLCSQL